MVLSSDHVYKLDYCMVVEAHRSRGAGLTMVTTVVPRDRARRFGNVEVDPDGRVRRFVYKPDEPVSDIVTTEVFVFDKARLLETVDELASGAVDEDGELEDFGDDLIPHLVDTILTTAMTRPPARCWEPASIDNALLSPGCVVRGRVERSVLAPGVVVEEGAHVQNSVLLHDTVVEAGTSVSGVICDMHVRIGGRGRVGETDGIRRARSDDDLVVLGEGVHIPSGAEVEPGTRQGGPGTAAGGQD